MEIVEGFKRFSKIYIDKNNFGYRVNKKRSDGKLFLRCYEDSCHGSGVYFSEENKFKAKTKHNHKADTLLILKWKFLQTVKHRAEMELTSIATIYQEECDNYPEVDHPPYSRLQSTLLKRRQAKKASDRISSEDSKNTLTLMPFVKTSTFVDNSKEKLEEEFQEGSDIQLDEALKVIPQIFTEYVTEFSSIGKIIDIVEGPKRFSRVFIDDVGYPYQQNKKRKDGTLLLRCHLEGCSGTGIFNPDTMTFQRLATHFHNPNPHSVLKLRFLQSIKLRAENESTSLSAIYMEEASRFQGTPLPSFDKIKSTLRKRRIASLTQNNDNESASFSRECSLKEKLAVATHFIGRKGMEVIEGPKRFSKIYIDDHSYCYLVNRRKTDGSLILRCHEDGCRGSGRFDPSESLFHKMAKHSHYADPLLVTRWRFLHQCKKRAENETTPIKTIYDQEYQRHPNCNLPCFKKIESTLQKRRKSKRLKEDTHSVQRLNSIDIPGSPRTYELEVQMEEVYHPEGNPRYFISPNISYDAPVVIQENVEYPAPIIVRTGKSKSFDENEFHNNHNSLNISCNKISPTQIKTVKKKGRKGKDETVKMKKDSKFKRTKPREPRTPSNYTSKMDVMEGTKRFSKIFIDESHHIYQLNKARMDGALILKCYETNCHGSGLYFPVEEIFQRNAEHNHDPSSNLVAKCRLLSILKFRAESESGSLRLIYEEEVAKFPGIEVASFRQMESTLQKRRRAKVPSEPTSLSEAAQQFQRTDFSKCDRGNFFRSFVSHYEHEMLVFVSPGPLEEKLKSSKTFHIDSSFRVVPQSFAQVVIIYVVVGDHVFPVVYALMNTKSSISYVKLFEFLKEEFTEFDPQFVSTDFENDLESAFQLVFPNAIITGCWFHYTQAIWRQMRTCGLAQVYFQDEEAKLLLRSAMALPLLPSVRIADGIAFLQENISRATFHLTETKNSLLKMIDFIRDHWLQRIGPNRFSVFGLERKLNYDIEALYRFFVKKLGIESPPLIKFVEKVFQAESILLGEYNQKLLGKSIRADRSRMCNENEKMLKDICSKFEASQMSVGVFLTSASTTVPRHCHHDYLIYNPDEGTSLQDPSDIPVSLPFCEINVVAPRDSDREEREMKPFNTQILESFHNTDGNLIIENLEVSEHRFQDLESVVKTQPQCHSTINVKEYSNVGLVWASSCQFVSSQEPSIHYSSSNPRGLKEEPNLFNETIETTSNSMDNSQKLQTNNVLSHSVNITENEIIDSQVQESCYNPQEPENLCQVSLINDNKSHGPVYLFYPDNSEKS